MTHISITKDGPLDKLTCNGRFVAFDGRITSIEKVGAGRWEGMAGGEPFRLTGGKAAGGTAKEWFIKWGPGFGEQYVLFDSARRALKAIENC